MALKRERPVSFGSGKILISPKSKDSGHRLAANQPVTNFTLDPVQPRSHFVKNPLIFFVCLHALVPEQSWNKRLWDAQLADMAFVVEASDADIKRGHRDLSIRGRRRAEKIDRADNFLQHALQIAFPDFIVSVIVFFRKKAVGE